MEITPKAVLMELQEHADEIESIFVVTREDGHPTVYGSGTIENMFAAAGILQGAAYDWSSGRDDRG